MQYCDTVASLSATFSGLIPWLSGIIIIFVFLGIFMTLTHKGEFTKPLRLAVVILLFTILTWAGLSILSCNTDPATGTETLPEVPNPQDVI